MYSHSVRSRGLAIGLWSGGPSCGTETFIGGIWCYLRVDCVRTELNLVEFLDTLLVSGNSFLVWEASAGTHTHIQTHTNMCVCFEIGSRNPQRPSYLRNHSDHSRRSGYIKIKPLAKYDTKLLLRLLYHKCASYFLHFNFVFSLHFMWCLKYKSSHHFLISTSEKAYSFFKQL